MQQSEELQETLFLEKRELLFQDFLNKVKDLIDKNRVGLRRCFISYAWEADEKANQDLQEGLKHLKADLEKVGVKTFLDINEMKDNMNECMQSNISESDYILLIGTPRYKECASQEKTNIAFEFQHVLKKVEAEKIKGKSNILLPILYSGSFKCLGNSIIM